MTTRFWGSRKLIYGYCTQLDTNAVTLTGADFAPHKCDQVVVERIQSASRARIKLAEVLNKSKKGDLIVVRQLSDLSWRLPELVATLESLNKRDIELLDMSSGLKLLNATAIDLCGALTKYTQSVSQLKTVYRHLQATRSAGRPSEISNKKWENMRNDLKDGMTVKEVAEKWKVKAQAVYYRRRCDADETASGILRDPSQIDIESYISRTTETHPMV
ncbi:recombinase family protein [Pseudovibrio sp. Ad37]|uniref:recombinase family protein n=1 Tax=Pseudovibrio sp. Ad37 TaxID=989422 RepID=UPI00187D6A09|nr:recombinase family protein [Pseudovibrio sp. Ad37]